MVKVARLAVSAAVYSIDRPYSYRIPEKIMSKAVPGMRVMVPFGRGNRHVEGVILALDEQPDSEKLKYIEGTLDDEPEISPQQLKLALWMRDRFFCTVYDALHVMLPAGMWFKDGKRKIGDKTVSRVTLEIPAEDAMEIAAQKSMRAPQQASVLRLLAQIGQCLLSEIMYFTGASRSSFKALENLGAISIDQQEVYRRPQISINPQPKPIVLTDEQQAVLDGLIPGIRSGKPDVALLYGVTGSGKTSVYIKLVEQVLKLGKSAMVLVPEIALTPQLMSLFASYFVNDVAVLHSSLGIGERCDEYKRIKNGQVHVVVGTRSAVFAPLKNLGLIIMDEEHERTYKSENAPRYHAREIAKYRCVHENALLLLGSATPSVESMYAAKGGRYKLFELTSRYNNMALPEVIISDMRLELKNGNESDIGAVLYEELKKNLDRGEQSILFINRRGASSVVACGECGYTFTCPNCSVSMTYHSANHRLMCHYCGFSKELDEQCPECGGKLKFIGAGTQKVQQELEELFPGIGIVRMDADTVNISKSHEALLDKFRDEKVPVLLGTQMVTKGLDFENVTLVGVINADKSLYLSDYRAPEKTFSMLTQVVGRSGRGSKAGRAVIQTYTPENPVIKLSASQDYDGFYNREIQMRILAGSPPVRELFSLTASGMSEASVLRMCVKLKKALSYYLADFENVSVMGPAPASIIKINNRYRYKITVSCENTQKIRNVLSHIVKEASKDKTCRGVSVYVDVDAEE